MSPLLLKIDELNRDDHFFLSPQDDCYYFMNYTAYAGYAHSPANQLIYNLKIGVNNRGTARWQHKESAITQASQLIKTFVFESFDNSLITYIPIPPSKCRTDALYDDRIARMLRTACRGMQGVDIREVFGMAQSIQAAHESDLRPTINEIRNNLTVNQQMLNDLRPHVVLVDDVLTTGAHFIACKQKILELKPDAIIHGVFLARREIPTVATT